MLTTIADLDAYVATRGTWHTLAERVLAPARHAVTGRIGLRPAPGGFATPEFGAPEPGMGRVLSVAGGELVDADAGTTRRHSITTLGGAAAFVAVDPAAETGVYAPTTSANLSTPLHIDAPAAAVLAEWFAFGDRVLATWSTRHADDTPTDAQLWPEHFDLALDLGPESGRANYGVSPGDGGHAAPYLYVGPWIANNDPFWNAGSYARLGYDSLVGMAAPESVALDFFARGYAVATRSGPPASGS